MKKSFGKKTGCRPHNGRWDYVGALGIPYSRSASLNRISERISACLRSRSCVGYMRRVFTFSLLRTTTITQRHGSHRRKAPKEKEKNNNQEEKENNGNERRRKDADPVITAEYFPLFVSFVRCIDACAFPDTFACKIGPHMESYISGELTTRRLEDPRG